MTIRVFIADDHAVVREGLARILNAMPDMTVAGSAADGREVLTQAPSADWDVLILDLSGLGDAGGVEVLDSLRRHVPDLPVIVYSMYPESQYGVRMLQAGARAYLCKDEPTETLLEAIRRVATGRRYITPGIAERLLDADTSGKALSTRELQVLQLLVEGKSVTALAKALHISMSTASTHIGRIKTKLGASSKADLVRIALRDGLCD
ncbi:MAG: response regulator transcription factor [Myxococcota bacterium]